MVPILVWRGIDEATAAYGVSLFAFGCVVTPLVFGWLGDRWSKTRLSAIGATVAVVGLLTLLGITSSSVILYLFPLTMAVVMGTAPLNWSIVGDYFGRTRYGTLRGITRVVNGIGTFLAPVYAGWMFDRTESYVLVLLPFALILLLSAVLFFRLHPPATPLTKPNHDITI
jgi:MFS family permease